MRIPSSIHERPAQVRAMQVGAGAVERLDPCPLSPLSGGGRQVWGDGQNLAWLLVTLRDGVGHATGKSKRTFPEKAAREYREDKSGSDERRNRGGLWGRVGSHIII
jgi:hypothetical protein